MWIHLFKHAVGKQITARFLFSVFHFENKKVSPFIIGHRKNKPFPDNQENRLAVTYTDPFSPVIYLPTRATYFCHMILGVKVCETSWGGESRLHCRC